MDIVNNLQEQEQMGTGGQNPDKTCIDEKGPSLIEVGL
jgi:hypothetical protein